MPLSISLQLSPKQAADPKIYVPIAARRAGVSDTQIALARVVKRSIDARKGSGTGAGRAPKVNITLELYIDNEPQPEAPHFDYQDVTHRTPVVIVGSGPAGLFAALRLIELGARPIILERGKEVVERGKDIAQINRGGGVDPDSNYAFGEGGAGTFSDGKLFTRSKKRGDYNRALQTLVFHGAAPEILYEAHPHIGTDRLPRIMAAIRETIRRSGGTVVFGARVTDIVIRDGRAVGVRYVDATTNNQAGTLVEGAANNQAGTLVEGAANNQAGTLVEGAAVILATGHSARDIYEILHSRGVALEAKPFAVGVRIEHPQQLIDTIQYHITDDRSERKGGATTRPEYLPAAAYQLVSQENGRGVWSFCMCPGGFIVPAMTSADESVVNGMSPSLRNSPWANSGIVTEVRLSDFEHLSAEFGPLAGLEFQRRLEIAARQHGADAQVAPAQRVADFVSARASKTLPGTSYVPGITPSRLDEWLPGFISVALKAGISTFGRRMRGFVTNEAVVVGVESRTSTPVRIPRLPDTLAHPAIANLYPAGEGAGYAGGIISAALDGQRIAEAVFS
jgi:uncharacterized FAD-dependent dehydrogenase